MKSTVPPRPILKRSPTACPENDSELPFYGIQAVHFPPSPSLSRFYHAHPSSIYDRSPIVVSANACALPERGCPGRTYTLDERTPSTSQQPMSLAPPPRGGHLHPRALSQRPAQYLQNEIPPHCPPLIPDLSSESEESDGFISPPPEMSYSSFGSKSQSRRVDRHPSQLSLDNAVYFTTRLDNMQLPSPADPRGKSRRDRERIRSPVGPGEVAADDPGYDDDRDVPPSSSGSISPRKPRCRKHLSSRTKTGFDDNGDGGCLGGF
ncbi:hypothetical protein EV361DRAFT_922112 [Lentinula raphanica]|nr:hypothetical protein EV360DRAFT_56802 [Lentinula raphanica]KAJ3825573.1 hypothetical protein F5880DRAFT_1551779 [Lentinula raphanica]KAJ3969215.1 hypothetical protein EV361DRAFT_922112 [Lentinula raphanica]